MFNVSDSELDGMEHVARRETTERPAFSPIPGYGGQRGYGDDGDPSQDPGSAPASAPSLGPVGPLAPAPLAPSQASPNAAAIGAGKALVWVTGGLVVGTIFGGWQGGAAGVVAVGAARNIGRVKQLWSSPNPSDRTEAGKSATMAFFGLGIAGLLGYHAYEAKKKDGFPW